MRRANTDPSGTDTLPPAVTVRLLRLLIDAAPVAVLRIAKDGRLLECGGSPAAFGLDDATPGRPATDRALFLTGLLPLGPEPEVIRDLDTGSPSGHTADLFLIPDAEADWAVLVDRTERHRWEHLARRNRNQARLLHDSKAAASGCGPTRPTHPVGDAPRDAPPNAFRILDILALEQQPDGRFRRIGPVPADLERLFPEACGDDGLQPQRRFPFLDNFLEDARRAWEHGERVKSGPWVETDPGGGEIALNATALCWGGNRLLLVEVLGSDYREHHAFLQQGRSTALLKDSLEEEVRRRTRDILAREEEIALRLVWATQAADNAEDTGHIRRIGLLAETLGEALGWRRDAVDALRLAATMHDIGKIAVPARIADKPGPLNADEFEIVKSHTVLGAKILGGSKVPLLRMAAEIALHHHERWDGSGYPDGLRGEAIPIAARVATVADCFDVATHQRPYKTALSVDGAFEVLRQGRGGQFDPRLVDLALDQADRFRRIATLHPAPHPDVLDII